MTKDEQKQFTKNLTGSIADKIIEQIDSGKIPENWDGVELRWLLQDLFSREARYYPDKRKSRWKDYDNTVIMHDL
jgi:hypothetical protein